MSFESLSWGVGISLGPVVTGAFFDAGRPYAVWTFFASGMAVAAIVLLAVERRLPEARKGVTR